MSTPEKMKKGKPEFTIDERAYTIDDRVYQKDEKNKSARTYYSMKDQGSMKTNIQKKLIKNYLQQRITPEMPVATVNLTGSKVDIPEGISRTEHNLYKTSTGHLKSKSQYDFATARKPRNTPDKVLGKAQFGALPDSKMQNDDLID